jgi:hypothetical protein
MMLPPEERDHASIIRDGEPSILDFHLIRHLATRWDGQAHCLSDSEMATGALYLRQADMMFATQNDIAAQLVRHRPTPAGHTTAGGLD